METLLKWSWKVNEDAQERSVMCYGKPLSVLVIIIIIIIIIIKQIRLW